MADPGLDTDFGSCVQKDITDLSELCAGKSIGSLYDAIQIENKLHSLTHALVDGMDNLGIHEEDDNIKWKPQIRQGALMNIRRSRIRGEQSSHHADSILIRDHIHPQGAQVGILSKINHVYQEFSQLQNRNFQDKTVVPPHGHVSMSGKLSGMPTSDSQQECFPRDAYLGLIARLEISLKKLHGTREDVAEGAEDLWEMIVQAYLDNDGNFRPTDKSRSGPSPIVSSLDQGILHFLWCHKSFFWHIDLVKSLKTLHSGVKAEPCQSYNLSLETARDVNIVLLEALRWLRSQPSLSGFTGDTPDKMRLDGAVHGYKASRFPCDLDELSHKYTGSETDDSIFFDTIVKKRRTHIDQMFVIDGPFDTRCPEVAAIASCFNLHEEASGLDAASRLTVETMKAVSSGIAAGDGGRGWDSSGLLQVADRIRAECDEEFLASSNDLVLVGCILKDILQREPHAGVAITFSDIRFSRLDKLLDHINGMEDIDLPQAKILHQVINLAFQVKSSWYQRFPGRFSTIDQDRVKILLDKITLKFSSKSGYQSWVPFRNPRVPIEEIQLEVGQWWPNIACIYRDGSVNSNSTERVFAIPTIPLLNGIEIHDAGAECLRYTLEGQLKDLKLSLQTKVGKVIRLLRGYKLKSLLAPEAGIRYDGKYHLSRYGHEYADPKKGVFRMTLWYERVNDQPALNSSALLYKPSMKDDWQLYKKVEDEDMKKSCTALDYAEWKAAEKREVIDCEEWKNEQALKE